MLETKTNWVNLTHSTTNHLLNKVNPTTEFIPSCISCKKPQIENTLIASHCCGEPIELIYPKSKPGFINLPISKDQFEKHQTLLSRCLPRVIKFDQLSSLLVGGKIFGLDLTHTPSGSFKDTGTCIELMYAVENNYTSVAVSSSGNMGASVALMSNYFEIECSVYVPNSTPQAKLDQIKKYGANLIIIDGDYNDAEIAVRKKAKDDKNIWLCGDYSLRGEGAKLTILPLFDMNKFSLIVPLGNGTLFGGIHLGIQELISNNEQIKLYGVQADTCNPIAYSIKHNLSKVEISDATSIASATSVRNPFDFEKVRRGILWSSGAVFSVSEFNIVKSQNLLLTTEAFDVEFSGALSLASILENSTTFQYSDVIITLTGHGFKNPIEYQLENSPIRKYKIL